MLYEVSSPTSHQIIIIFMMAMVQHCVDQRWEKVKLAYLLISVLELGPFLTTKTHLILNSKII